MRRFRPAFDQLESKTLSTVVFIFNGNAFAAAKPSALTHAAAAQLIRDGDRPIELASPAMTSANAFYELADSVRVRSGGQAIALVGFSAGGSLAMRLAGQPGLNVEAVMNYYGSPDLRAWINYHRGDHFYQYVASHVRLTGSVIDLLSGPSQSRAFVVSAFGLRDGNVVSTMSAASFDSDFHQGQVFYYEGPHGVGFRACLPAWDAFLAHL
jgi:hypothetical protein